MDRPRLDRVALASIVVTSGALVAVASVTTWRVATGTAGDMGPVDWFVYGLFAVVAVVLTVAVVLHLRPAVRLRLTTEGISTGGTAIAWSDVHRIERPGCGRRHSSHMTRKSPRGTTGGTSGSGQSRS